MDDPLHFEQQFYTVVTKFEEKVAKISIENSNSKDDPLHLPQLSHAQYKH